MNHNENPLNKEALTKAFLTANFFKRVVTALLLGGLTLWMLITESPFTGYFMILICAIVLVEWMLLVFRSPKTNWERLVWLFFGGAYLTLGLMGFYKLYDYSAPLGLGLLLVIWSTDIGAYFAGKILKGPKLAPRISPGKTWSGALGGTFIAALTALLISAYLYEDLNVPLVSFFIVCSILGQLGDLLESKVKRCFNVKDSGNLLPGHGGFIDRLDSLVLIGFVLYALHFIMGFSQIFTLRVSV